jgi:RNA polymerase sigma factor (sigma-70 family)
VEELPAGNARLIARAKRGDLRAYEQIVEQHQATAFRVAWLITASSADAEEAAQDAFLKAYRALGKFRDGAPFRPWLLRIVANEARNRRVAAGRRERLALRLLTTPVEEEAGISPEAALLESDTREELISALGSLEDRDRLVIACRYFLDLSEAETAAALGCRRGTVKSRLSRALARLRAEMEDDRG